MKTVAALFHEAPNSDRQFGKLSRCLDFLNGLEIFQAYKERSWRILAPAAGARILDLACGTGFDVRGMAALWPSASFVGVDGSERFLDVARERSEGLTNVAFVHADAKTLPFQDGAFDGARVDRSLQHIVDPGSAIAEMKRVVRGGGALVACEPDWGTFLLENGDGSLSERIASQWRAQFVNPCVGRQVPRLMRSLGVDIDGVSSDVLVLRDYGAADIVADIETTIKGCIAEGAFSLKDGEAWIERAKTSSAQGDFLAMLCILTTAGRVRK